MADPKQCKCGKDLPPRRTYCNRKCFMKFRPIKKMQPVASGKFLLSRGE